MKTLRNYTKTFLHEEEGMELLQLVIVVVITVALMGVVFTLKNTIQTNMSDANDLANNTLRTLDQTNDAGIFCRLNFR